MIVNGTAESVQTDGRVPLATVLRDLLGITSVKIGCDDCECGACMVLIDDRPVNACSTLALQADGAVVTTAEGLAPPGALSMLQQALLDEGGVQCGFCTPGVVIAAEAFLRSGRPASEVNVRAALAGNLCRCTGYTGIVRAVLATAARQTHKSDRGDQ